MRTWKQERERRSFPNNDGLLFAVVAFSCELSAVAAVADTPLLDGSANNSPWGEEEGVVALLS